MINLFEQAAGERENDKKNFKQIVIANN